jgi:hypothetical protein
MFSDESRATFATLADVFLPATAAMPAASQAGVADSGLDALADAAPRLASQLAEILAGVALGTDPTDALERLQAGDLESYEVIRVAVGAAYYLDAGVRDLLGYPGQAPTQTIPGHDDGYLNDGLLDHVAERGARYRSV